MSSVEALEYRAFTFRDDIIKLITFPFREIGTACKR